MTLVEGEELQRLWALVSELSSQLSANRELCRSLQAQADELKGQALHTGTGYTLRRFNLDISKEKFESDLEKLNSQLVMENHSLTHENKQINVLLREYENTLETIMSKFRSFSHATQQHTLSLTSHYETLLANDVHQAENTSLHASTSFSNTLAHLGGLVRLALREVEGEGGDSDEEDDLKDLDPFEAEGYRVGSPSGIGPSSHTDTSSKRHSAAKRAKTGYGSAPSRDPRWYGTGGYTGLQGDPEAEKADRALQARTEEERLRNENETLRELLRISTDITPEVAREFGIEIPPPATSTSWSGTGLNTGKLSLGKARGSRKSITEATLPVKTAEPETASSASTSTQVKTEDDELDSSKKSITGRSSLLATEAFEKYVDPEFQSSSEAPSEPPSSDSSKIMPSHDVSGSGGPPHLMTSIEEEESKKDSIVNVVLTTAGGSDEKAVEKGEAAKEEEEEGTSMAEVLEGKGEGEGPVTKEAADDVKLDAGAEAQLNQVTSIKTEATGKQEEHVVPAVEDIDDKATVRDKLLDEVEETIQGAAEVTGADTNATS